MMLRRFAVSRRGFSLVAAPRGRAFLSSSSRNNPLDDMPSYVAKFQFSRSSGPGGQNVNKVNTRAQIRIDLTSAVKSGWLQQEDLDRLVAAEASRVTSSNELIISSQESRTQKENRQSCLDKLATIVKQCRIKPVQRKVKIGISEATKAKRRDSKRLRSAVKQNRSKVIDWSNFEHADVDDHREVDKSPKPFSEDTKLISDGEMATTTTIFSPSREAARANAAKQAEFVLSRRQQEREAALRRVRCSFTRRGKWTKSQYPKEIDRDVARIVVGSGRRFLIVRRARKALIAKRRALAGPVLASFLTRHFRRRAELARLLQNRRQVAASYLANRWLAWHESKKRRRVEAAAEIVEFLCRARARRQARGEAAKRISASKAIGRWGKECAARLKWARRRRRACFSIQRATRVELRRRVRAATRIEGAHRARLARERRRVLAYQRYQDTIANVIIRSVRVALAKGRSRAILDERRRRAAACALAGATIALVYCARLREKRRAVEVVAQQNQAAGRLTTFARGIIAKAWRRRIVYARDALLAAELIQRVWRGYVGRKRFAKIKSEAFRCRRCDNMEWGGRYCKQCGFARYEQPVVQIEYGDSPYAPPRVRPSFVNKMRSRIAAAKKRAAERSLFLGKSSTLGPETTSGGNELGVEDARIAADAERLARLALQQSKKMTKGTIPPERSDDLLILSGAAKNLRSVVKAKGRKAAKKQEAYLEHYCSILQSASNSRT